MDMDQIKTTFWKVFKGLANLKLALSVLFIIICFCIIGSVLEQDKDINYYFINYSFYSYFILFFGFDHVFRNWWFISTLFILSMSLVSCSLVTQLPSLKNARRWKFMHTATDPNKYNYSMYDSLSSNYSSINIIYSLLRLRFLVFCRGSSIYSYKGLYGRIAPIFVHISIILILLGSVYGFLCSFVLQEMVPVGEIFHFKNIVYSGYYSSLKYNLYTYVNNFYIKYIDNTLIDQFFSNLSVYSDNKMYISYNWLFVNKPMYIDKVTFYQTDWEIVGIRFCLGDDYFVQKKMFKQIKNNNLVWVANLYLVGGKKVSILLTGLNNKILIFDDRISVSKEVGLGQKFYINSTPIKIQKIISSTGLQIKFDPGIPLVYLGFFTMIISTFISYLSYSQIWIYRNINIKSLEFFGSTNRASLFLEQDLLFVDKFYSYYLLYAMLPSQVLNKILR